MNPRIQLDPSEVEYLNLSSLLSLFDIDLGLVLDRWNEDFSFLDSNSDLTLICTSRFIDFIENSVNKDKGNIEKFDNLMEELGRLEKEGIYINMEG